MPSKVGEKPQSTEDSIGPYALQDFTLYHVLRRGHLPSKIAFLAAHAWTDAEQGDWPPNYPDAKRRGYDLATIRRWMQVFGKRYFANPVSYTHLRAHETVLDIVCRLLLEKKT